MSGVSEGQQERLEAARRTLGRAAGEALVEMSAGLDVAVVTPGAGGKTLILIGLAARGRRILRAAYRLLDAGEEPEAAVLFRTLNDYGIVSRWLFDADEDALKLWALEDLQARRTVLLELSADENVDLTNRTWAAEEADRTLAQMQGWGWAERSADSGDVCPTCSRPLQREKRPRTPTREQMARATGTRLGYTLAYRIQSQSAVHASPLAVDQCFEELPGGNLGVRAKPKYALEPYDSYQLGAHLLLDLLRVAGDHIPELGWREALDAVQETLDTVRRSESRSDEGPPNVPQAAQ